MATTDGIRDARARGARSRSSPLRCGDAASLQKGLLSAMLQEIMSKFDIVVRE